jgi:hypothetical protein
VLNVGMRSYVLEGQGGKRAQFARGGGEVHRVHVLAAFSTHSVPVCSQVGIRTRRRAAA